MTPYYAQGSVTLYVGDCREVLASLPDQSVQCVVTSPPYFGLRDYGVAGQIGLEQTPQAYVREMVAVFREVRRVLRDDGTVFLNLGDSYFGSGKGPTGWNGIGDQVRRQGFESARDASAYGNGGTASLDYPASDSTSRSPDDGRTDAWWNRIPRSDLRHALEQVGEPLRRIRACMATLRDRLPSGDYSDLPPIARSSSAILAQAQTAARAVERLHASLASTPLESYPPPPAGFHLSDMLSACLSSLHSFAACVRRCAHTWDAVSGTPHCTADTASLFEELAHHIRCTDGYCSLLSAWLNPPYIEPQCTTSALKPKDLLGIPWRVAFALQEDGWYLRSDIIWAKPNPMPESVTDRPTRAHEYLFLLTKSARYHYDADAIAEPSVYPMDARGARVSPAHKRMPTEMVNGIRGGERRYAERNKRSVWTVATQPFTGWTETSRRVRVAPDEADGDTKRITSPDCPLHGDRACRATTAFGDGHAAVSRSRTAGNGSRPALGQTSLLAPTDPRHGGDFAGDSSDSLTPAYAPSATLRSTQTSRTGHAPATSSPYMPSAESLADTPDTSALPSSVVATHLDTRESRNGTAGLLDHPSPDTSSGTPDTSSQYPSSSASDPPCTCTFYKEITEKTSHFATFPPKLIEPCILAGCPVGGVVLDPFAGAGTTLMVAQRFGRQSIGIELNAAYADMAIKRLGQEALPLEA